MTVMIKTNYDIAQKIMAFSTYDYERHAGIIFEIKIKRDYNVSYYVFFPHFTPDGKTPHEEWVAEEMVICDYDKRGVL